MLTPFNRIATVLLLAAGGFALSAKAAPTPDAAAAGAAEVPATTGQIVRGKVDGHDYLDGGFGRSEAKLLEHASKPYNLRLAFSEGAHNAFVTGLTLRIEDAQGRKVFALENAGPLVDVKLPSGQYRVLADFDGVQRGGTVDLRQDAPARMYLHWAHDLG